METQIRPQLMEDISDRFAAECESRINRSGCNVSRTDYETHCAHGVCVEEELDKTYLEETGGNAE
ncbi:MAG: hypothetical protein KKF56_01900 [Nanoarchaeota archaeon]|nr:hypothetical protein [Nanoarchaeota archaeon]